MKSLADADEVVGFFSYSRDDDEDSKGALSELRDAIQRELGGLLGRSRRTLRLWQDKEAIVAGKLWEGEINTATRQSVFFIPIVTPRTLNSKYCKYEFDAFLAREQALGRDDLVFPILYIRVPALEKESLWRNDPVLSVIGARQYVDWRILRQHQVDDKEVRQAVADFCAIIADALQLPITAEMEARAEREAARRLAEARALEAEQRSQQEAEASRAAEAARLEQAQRAAAIERHRIETTQRERAAEDERLRVAAAEDLKRQEAEKARLEQRRHASGARTERWSISEIVAGIFLFLLGLGSFWTVKEMYIEYTTKPSVYTIVYIFFGLFGIAFGGLLTLYPIFALFRGKD